MNTPAFPMNEIERLRELYSLNLLDTADEKALDDIVKIAAFITDTPITLISLVDKDRQWFKAKVGLEAPETPRDISFCGHAILQDELFEIPNALEDSRFSDNPLVTSDPFIRFYAGQPLVTKHGFKIGTLCVIDKVAKKLNEKQKEMMKTLAEQAMYIIERRLNDFSVMNIQKNIGLLFAKSPVIISFMKGSEHIFEYVNEAHIKLLDGVDATGKRVIDVQPEAKDTGLLAILDDVFTNAKTISLENTPFLIGTETKYFDFIFTPSFGFDGKVDGVMGIVNDISVKKNLENEIIVSLNELKTERDLRETFVAALTHDLRTPLTAAKMSAQILERKLDPSTRILTGRIINNMNRADHMIRDILDASKIKAGERIQSEMNECDLSSLIESTTEELITIHGDRFVVKGAQELYGRWAPDLIRRIIENLANNAIKYGSQTAPITIEFTKVKNMVNLSVHNFGNPISLGEHDLLFKPYNRLANAASQKGWGIGLTLVKGFAEAMNGHVKVNSSEILGTTFSVSIPYERMPTSLPQ